MESTKQVESSHYNFKNYMTKERWSSYWHQIDLIISCEPRGVLEIGPGAGLLKKIGNSYNVNIETLDLDPELSPDHIAPVDNMPFGDSEFDVVCAFQMLEHLPYDTSLKSLAEMSRVASKKVIISLPDASPLWNYSFYIPKIGRRNITVRNPFFKPKKHEFDGEHYWEINKAGYELDKVIRDFQKICPLEKNFRVLENPYHHFFVFNSS